MGYTIHVNHPHHAEGKIFNIGGLDRVPNGGTFEVDEEMERMFIMQQGQSIEDAFKNDAIVSVSGSSALDKSELDALVSRFGPQPEEESVYENMPVTENEPEWSTPQGATDYEGGEK